MTAERIAWERMESVGKTIGYNIRLDSAVGEETQMTFMTPGVLLRKLATDPTLSEYTHIVIDEVHENDRNTAFLLIVLKDLLEVRPELTVVLMSATLQVDKISGYFNSCPTAVIGCTRYPVLEFFLEDVLMLGSWGRKLGKTGDKNPLLKALCKTERLYMCCMCGKQTFRTPEELGTHVSARPKFGVGGRGKTGRRTGASTSN